jgi:hypothetical protein
MTDLFGPAPADVVFECQLVNGTMCSATVDKGEVRVRLRSGSTLLMNRRNDVGPVAR